MHLIFTSYFIYPFEGKTDFPFELATSGRKSARIIFAYEILLKLACPGTAVSINEVSIITRQVNPMPITTDLLANLLIEEIVFFADTGVIGKLEMTTKVAVYANLRIIPDG